MKDQRETVGVDLRDNAGAREKAVKVTIEGRSSATGNAATTTQDTLDQTWEHALE